MSLESGNKFRWRTSVPSTNALRFAQESFLGLNPIDNLILARRKYGQNFKYSDLNEDDSRKTFQEYLKGQHQGSPETARSLEIIRERAGNHSMGRDDFRKWIKEQTEQKEKICESVRCYVRKEYFAAFYGKS
jgi:hypothetical protein